MTQQKIREKFGVAGVIIFYIICIALTIMPLIILDFPFWGYVIAIILMFIPTVGPIATFALYVWATIIAVNSRIGTREIIFFVSLVLNIVVMLIPWIGCIISEIKKRRFKKWLNTQYGQEFLNEYEKVNGRKYEDDYDI